MTEHQPPRRLTRDTEHRMIGGVCAGIARYFDWDTTLVRVVFLILTFAIGSGVIVYLLAWVIIPADVPPIATTTDAPPPPSDPETDRANTGAAGTDPTATAPATATEAARHAAEEITQAAQQAADRIAAIARQAGIEIAQAAERAVGTRKAPAADEAADHTTAPSDDGEASDPVSDPASDDSAEASDPTAGPTA